MSNRRMFETAQLIAWDLPYFGDTENVVVLKDEVVDKTRWYEHHRLIFQTKDQYESNFAWEVFYTENQSEDNEEGPWENTEVVEGRLLEYREVPVMKWVRV